ncbi:fused MFS/spermidine synthase [Flavobacterium sp.]|uniref:spermidine synthase n=1 Tax=Flavobacterium sp. TaxID=239 RepID=UPI00286C5520|nr:fused MFS/spermidine synthase [Flavobacterium sp.]
MLRRVLSFLIPIRVYQKKSMVSKSIEINWNNGQLVLDSQNTNYSYGSLQRVLRLGLKKIGFEKIKSMNNLLILGVAGGSVIKTLVDEIHYKGKITGVEIDPEVIQIANEYFYLDKIPNLNIIIDDAFEFVLKTKATYDLIIIDVFQDTQMPNFLFEKFFINRIGALLNEQGYILFNTMTLDEKHNQRNKEYLSEFNTLPYTVFTIPRIENHNELIVIQKSFNKK